LTACGTPAKVVKLDQAKESSAKSFENKSPNGRIYFTNGKVAGTLNKFLGMYPDHRHSADVIVNGTNVASINTGDVVVFDVKPGLHTLAWNVRSTDLILEKTVPGPYEFLINAGDIKLFRGDFDMGAGSLIGAMASPPRTSIVEAEQKYMQSKNFVGAQNCPATICK
jgi:hypothetical protein